jgi:hypothetical protein
MSDGYLIAAMQLDFPEAVVRTRLILLKNSWLIDA